MTTRYAWRVTRPSDTGRPATRAYATNGSQAHDAAAADSFNEPGVLFSVWERRGEAWTDVAHYRDGKRIS